MEADWSAEIAPGLPEIIVPWSDKSGGETLVWLDLRLAGLELDAAIQSIPSAAQEPALADALRVLHQPDSSWFTSKCDVWTAEPDAADAPDPYEFDAADLAPAPLYLCASYLDVLARDAAPFASFAAHENFLSAIIGRLRAQSQPHARMDFVLRAARIHDTAGFAFTAYAAGCGLTAEDAHREWEYALGYLVTAIK